MAEEALRQQQAPEYTAEVENPNGDDKGRHGWHRLMLRVVKSPAGALDELRVDLLTDGVHFTPGQNGVAPTPQPGAGRQYTAVHAYERIGPASIDAGERAHWRIEFDVHKDQLPAIEQVEIRVTAVRNSQPWVAVLEVPVQARLTHNKHLEQQKLQQQRMADEHDRALRQGVWKHEGAPED